jgi:hypothetical protein
MRLTIPYSPHRSIGVFLHRRPQIDAESLQTRRRDEAQEAVRAGGPTYRKVFFEGSRLRVTRNFQPAANSAQAPTSVDAWVQAAPEKYREEYRVAGEAIKACERGDTANLSITGKHITRLPTLPSIVEKLRLVDMPGLKYPPDTSQCKHLAYYEAKGCPWRELSVGHLTNLRSIDVSGSEQLQHLRGTHHCLLLEEIHAEYCRKLTSVRLAPQPIKVLNLDGCTAMDGFPRDMEFSGLTQLHMRSVPIQTLPQGLIHALIRGGLRAMGVADADASDTSLQSVRLHIGQLTATDQATLRKNEATADMANDVCYRVELM